MTASKSKQRDHKPPVRAGKSSLRDLSPNRQPERSSPHHGSLPGTSGFDAIEDMAPELVRQRWRILMGRSPPPHLPHYLLTRALNFREQIAQTGDIDAPTQLKLSAALSGDKAPPSVEPRSHARALLRPGTLLMREHNQKRHQVRVLVDGFSWNGTTYSSLSKVAFAITGTHWNGRRFFGLPKTPKKGGSSPLDATEGTDNNPFSNISVAAEGTSEPTDPMGCSKLSASHLEGAT